MTESRGATRGTATTPRGEAILYKVLVTLYIISYLQVHASTRHSIVKIRLAV